MLKILFYALLQAGIVNFQDHNDDLDKDMYYFTMLDSTAVEYAYPEEVMHYFVTGEFKYDEDLEWDHLRYTFINKHW